MSRVGNFSSSEIWKLTKLARNKKDFGQVALTYIKEKSYEQKLGRSLNSFTWSKPTSWGSFCEAIAYEYIKGWELVSEDRLFHPDIKFWSGIPDIVSLGKVGDIKCPFTLKSFCELVDCETGQDLKNVNEAYYWQLVSNAILTHSNEASLFIWVPYKGELPNIRERAIKSGDESISWLAYAPDNDLPFLILGNDYDSLNELKFKIPEQEKDFLTQQVKKAIELL